MTPFIAFRGGALVLAAVLGLGACAPVSNSSTVPVTSVRQSNDVTFGQIVDARTVEVQNVPRGEAGTGGAVVGGLLGARAGSEIGDGRGQDLATGVGAVAGAVIGSRAGQRLNRSTATEWFVRLDNGRTISVIQNDSNLRIGANVRVVSDGRTTRLVS